MSKWEDKKIQRGGGSAMECLLLVKKIDENKERINLSWLK